MSFPADLTFDSKRGVLTSPTHVLGLPQQQARVFAVLWRGRACDGISAQDLKERMGGRDYTTAVSILRRKLVPFGLNITVERAYGYRLVASGDNTPLPSPPPQGGREQVAAPPSGSLPQPISGRPEIGINQPRSGADLGGGETERGVRWNDEVLRADGPEQCSRWEASYWEE